MYAECPNEHNESEEEDGVHCAVFEIDVSLYPLNVVYGEVADDKRTEAVADEDERNG